MMHLAKFAVQSLPPIRRLLAERDLLRRQRETFEKERAALETDCAALRRDVQQLSDKFEAAEIRRRLYDSPIPSLDDIKRYEARLFDRSYRAIPGIDLNVNGQLEMVRQFQKFYRELPFPEEPVAGSRYYFRNDWFSYSDAIFLYSMMRHSRPQKIIEIGSGFSSFVMLDTNERFFDGGIRLTFVEPHDERLRSRLQPSDLASTRIIAQPVQDVDLRQFDELEAGDILFVDSSHVAKIGSDVNHVLFEILPRLRSGVFVHVHDVFYPFEYPRDWIEAERYWNEDYLLRAFLQFNSAFQIVVWDEFLGLFHAELLAQAMPFCLKNTGGSMWIKKL